MRMPCCATLVAAVCLTLTLCPALCSLHQLRKAHVLAFTLRSPTDAQRVLSQICASVSRAKSSAKSDFFRVAALSVDRQVGHTCCTPMIGGT
jgi:hypothetical protein